MKFLGSAVLAAVVLMASCGADRAGAAQTSGVDPIASFVKGNGLEGQVVLVEFGTIGCELSDKGLSAMADLAGRKAIPGLAFARIEPTADSKVFEEYYKPKSLPFPVVRDTQMVLAKALGTAVYPQFALLDRFGRVRYRGGQPQEKDLAAWAESLLSEEKDPGPGAPLFGRTEIDAAGLLATTRLPDLSGAVKPLSEHKAKIGLLLAFVDTKCPFSNVAVRQIPRVSAALQAKEVATLLVNIGEPEAAVKKAYAPGTAVVYDTGKQTQKCWSVQSVPTLVLLDAAGTIAYRGGAVWPEVARATEKMLGLAAGSVQFEAQSTAQG